MPTLCNAFRGIVSILFAAGLYHLSLPARADATLIYDTVTPEGARTMHTFSIRGRFVRVDMDSDPERHWVIDTGLLTIADVDRSKKRYTFDKLPRPTLPGAVTTAETDTTPPSGEKPADGTEAPPDAASPEQQVAAPEIGSSDTTDGGSAGLIPEPTLVPDRKKDAVAKIGCRIVMEMADDRPIAEHCMAGTGALGLTTREMITLSRLFTTARRLGLGWMGAATADERIVSISSRQLDGGASQVLRSVSYEYLPNEDMRVPKSYQRIKPGEQEGKQTGPAEAEQDLK